MLTDKGAKNAKAKAKPYKKYDRDALYLYVSITGARSWRFDFRYFGTPQTLTYGKYPELTLAEAREKHELARKALAKGENPAVLKKREKMQAIIGGSFKALGEAWYEDKVKDKSRSWRDYARRYLDLSYAYIGSLQAKGAGPAEVLSMLRDVSKKRGPHTAACVRKICSLVFEYGIQALRVDANPARSMSKLIAFPKAKSHPHLEIKEIPALLKAVEKDGGDRKTKLAIRLLLLTFVRKSELLDAKWTELNLEEATWLVPAERMKGKKEILIPLASQAVECFRQLKTLAGGSEYVFPKLGDAGKPMGKTTLNITFHRIGYGGKFTPHSARSTASTALHDAGFPPLVVEKALAHSVKGVAGIYNRALFLQERRDMAVFWADLIDSLCSGGKVVPIRGKAA